MASPARITLLVEGSYDQMLVGWILEAAGLPLDRIDVVVGGGKGVVRETKPAAADKAADKAVAKADKAAEKAVA